MMNLLRRQRNYGYGMRKTLAVIPLERIQRTIYLLRGEKVMLDGDLAALYGVTTSNLNKAVRRNLQRFPADFMFRLTAKETKNLIFQIGTSSSKHGGRRKPISAFTEHGVAMLSSVLRSERAVQVNIAIMRAFVQLRQVLGSHAELARKLSELEQRIEGHDGAIRSLFDAIRQLMEPSKLEQPTKEIGFHVKEESVTYRIKRAGRKSIRPGEIQVGIRHPDNNQPSEVPIPSGTGSSSRGSLCLAARTE